MASWILRFILDETDSGLDIDALRLVAEGVNNLRNEKDPLLSLHIIKDCSTT